MINENAKETKEVTLWLILSRFFWVLFWLIGLTTIFSQPMPGLMMLVMAAVLVPPVNKLISEKWKLPLSGWIKWIIIVVCFIIYSGSINPNNSSNIWVISNSYTGDSLANILSGVVATWSSDDQVDTFESLDTDAKVIVDANSTIPGISGVDVYGNLENIGFSCSWPDMWSDWWVSRQCKEETSDHAYIVDILGESPSSISIVKATSLNYSSQSANSMAKEFLWYVASVDYSNSTPAFAKSWVMKNVWHNTNKVINGMKFSLVWNAQARILTIANKDSNLD